MKGEGGRRTSQGLHLPNGVFTNMNHILLINDDIGQRSTASCLKSERSVQQHYFNLISKVKAPTGGLNGFSHFI